MEMQGGKRKPKSDFQLRVNHNRNVRLFRDSYTAKWPYIPSECDDYAFCKVCDDSFSIAHGPCPWMMVGLPMGHGGGNSVSHGHIVELNKL